MLLGSRVQLSEKEQLFLNAAEFGQNDVVASLLMGEEPEVDANCMDYMGRSALILAIRCASQVLLFVKETSARFHCVAFTVSV